MSWQDLLGVRWSWQPRRSVRVVVATSVTVVVVASLLLVLAGLCLSIGVGWTAILVATAILFLWIAEKWWIVFDPDNLLLWLKLLPGIWRWVHEDDPVPPSSKAESVRHTGLADQVRPPRRW
jgi:hypothetical protein